MRGGNGQESDGPSAAKAARVLGRRIGTNEFVPFQSRIGTDKSVPFQNGEVAGARLFLSG